MKTTSRLSFAFALSSAVGIVGCATAVPPQDLVNARAAYHRASTGPAQQLDPADMHVAQDQLSAAEASFANDGDTQATRDQSYLAVRKTELAEVRARTMQSTQAKEGILGGMRADQKKAVALTSAELARANGQLATQGVALMDETSRRIDAEKRAAQAAADLAKFASVKQESRGMVITLSGSVLFASGKWALLPTAQAKLNEVASALTKEDPTSKIVVEGHTDSQGTATFNQDLSQQRAQSVRDYLVTRGIASDRVTAQGFGLTRAIADNASPEGRANNRRVEIVVLPVKQ
jgi:outer membrane protein OmpA-like peptidoglycan-associated protein